MVLERGAPFFLLTPSPFLTVAPRFFEHNVALCCLDQAEDGRASPGKGRNDKCVRAKVFWSLVLWALPHVSAGQSSHSSSSGRLWRFWF
jgi:hypothetical protein